VQALVGKIADAAATPSWDRLASMTKFFATHLPRICCDETRGRQQA